MKKIIKKTLTMLTIFAFLFTSYANSIYAFDNTIGPIKRSQAQDAANPSDANGTYYGQRYKFDTGNNQTVFCSLYSRDFSDNHNTYTLNDDWTEPVRAGVAYILTAFNFNNITLATFNNYSAEQKTTFLEKNLQVTLTINKFLLESGAGTGENKVDGKDPEIFMDENSKAILQAAKTERDHVSALVVNNQPNPTVKIDLVETYNTTYNPASDDPNYNTPPTATYKVTSNRITSDLKVTVGKGQYGIPADISFKVFKSTDGINYSEVTTITNNSSNYDITFESTHVTTNYPEGYIRLKMIDNRGDKSRSIITSPSLSASASVSYNIARNYSSGDDYQKVTPNHTEEVKENANFGRSMLVKGSSEPEFPKLKIRKIESASNNPLQGAKIKISNQTTSEVITKEDTGDNGETEIIDLDEGKYCVTEIKAPSGYKLNDTPHCFEVKMESQGGTNTITVTKDDNNDNTIVYDNNSQNPLITVTLEDTPNEIKIQKINKDGDPVSGATLKLYKVNLPEPTLIREWNTEESAETFNKLDAGKYYIEETKAPNGYKLNSLRKYFNITGTEKNTITVNFTNFKTKIAIRKVDENSQQLSGATLQIKDENGTIIVPSISTGTDTIIKGVLSINTPYILEEVTPPSGYAKADPIKFHLNNSGQVVIDEGEEAADSVTVILTNKKNTVKVDKKDQYATTGDSLTGAKLQLQKLNATTNQYETVNLEKTTINNETILTPTTNTGTNYESWTTTASPFTIKGLEPGQYRIKEIQAPPGYQLQSEEDYIKFTVENDGKVKLNGQDKTDKTINVTNKKSEVVITKTDKDGHPLANAELQLQKKKTNGEYEVVKLATYTYGTNNSNEGLIKSDDGNETWTTNGSEQKIFKLEDGDYQVVEITPPPGFHKNNGDPIRFSIANGVVTTENSNGDKKITITNLRNKITISKLDKNGNNLAGAELQLQKLNETTNKYEIVKLKDVNGALIYDENGTIESWETTEQDRNIYKLVTGKYKIVELKSPDGYVIGKDISFEVNDEGNVIMDNESIDDNKIKVENTKNYISISKTDINGNKLKGAVLQLLDSNNNVVKLRKYGTTGLMVDENGTIESWETKESAQTIYRLPEGKYKVKEIKAPEGYVLTDEVFEFEVVENGVIKVNNKKSSTLLMSNDKTKVYISKQDITNSQELVGATLVLTDESGTEIETWVSESEPHLIEGLVPGTYTLTETIAPEGYTKSEETITFTIDENGALSGNTIMYNTPIPDVEETFAAQSLLFTLIGIVLVGSGVGLYIYGIKKKKEI